MEEKLKKVTTERAPIAGPASGASRRNLTNFRDLDLSEGSELRNLLRMPEESGGASLGGAGGAAAAAGVLTAVDEDGEGDEEAPMPDEFDYFTEEEDDEDE